MSAWRIITVVVGLFFFVAAAVLDGVMAGAASSIRPLVLLWLLVPMPLVFGLLAFRRPERRGIRLRVPLIWGWALY